MSVEVGSVETAHIRSVVTDRARPRLTTRLWGWVRDHRIEIGLVMLTLLAAWFFRFVIDDAYISFRYAKNAAEGRGLVYNPGEYVEGYTNFLFTLLLIIPFQIGMQPEGFAHFLTLTSLLATLVLTFMVANQIVPDRRVGQLGVLLLVTNVTFVSFGTSGLETQTQTTLIMLAIWLVLGARDRPPALGRVLAFSVVATLALLVRLDSAVPVTVLAIAWLVIVVRSGQKLGATVARLLPGLVIPLVTLVPWFVWKQDFYSELLPNTFFAKATKSFEPMGFVFLGVFVASYLLFVPIGVLIAKLRQLARVRGFAVLIAILATWCAYVVYAGGDWMDFRFMVVVMPALFLLISAATLRVERRWLQILVVVSCLAGSLVHAFWPGAANVDGLPTVRLLATAPPPNWETEGRWLERYFPGGIDEDGQVTVAVVAAGAIPYFSELPSIDMIGLTDREIARDGNRIPYSSGVGKPGHLRIASVDYLRERGVNLVIGIPNVSVPEEARSSYQHSEVVHLFHEYPLTPEELGDDARLIEIPVDDGKVLRAIYLEPHPDIERHIAEGWRVLPIEG